jgi:hypothetical protein
MDAADGGAGRKVAGVALARGVERERGGIS